MQMFLSHKLGNLSQKLRRLLYVIWAGKRSLIAVANLPQESNDSQKSNLDMVVYVISGDFIVAHGKQPFVRGVC